MCVCVCVCVGLRVKNVIILTHQNFKSSKVKVVLTELKPLKGFNSVSTTYRTAFRKEKQM